MRVTVRVDVHSRAKEVAARGPGFAAEFARAFAEEAAAVARRNVSQGQGPGPHPHVTEHDDTGALRDSIRVRSEHRGFLESAAIYTDLEYGLYLEWGFTSRGGRFFRYPWLAPAVEEVRHKVDAIARSTGRRWFGDVGRPYAGRINMDDVPQVALLPQLRG